MKHAMLALPLLLAVLLGGTASAQNVFIQIEAHPDFETAQERARIFAEYLPDVRGLEIGSRWYGIALGPYDPETARFRLEALKELSMIPADSYLAERDAYSRQYFPAVTDNPPVAPTEFPRQDIPTEEEDSDATTVAEPQPPVAPEETRRQALQSEFLLSSERKLDLQRALRGFGFYDGSLDAVFGRGTRRAMADWQASKGHEPTGVLTSRQREEILADREALLAPLKIQRHLDEVAGIEIDLPGAMVVFDRYEPPFAHYGAKNDSGVSVTLISQAGDEITLRALYDVMQAQEVVPPDARRQRTSRQFTISSAGDRGRLFVYAALGVDGVKGFILTWPEQDELLHGIVLEAMLESFTPISGTVMPDVHRGGGLGKPIDLIDGLEFRKPQASYSGFYIDGSATVLTTDKAVNGCGRITLDGLHDAELVAMDELAGLALLTPAEPLVPIDYARIQTGAAQPRSRVAVSGYSFGGTLGAPTLTFGRLANLQGLNGENTVRRLALAASPGDAGGPVLDATGSLLGLLLPADTESGRQLPPDVSFAVNTATISEFVENNGYTLEASQRSADISAVAMTEMAADMTVLVSCWTD